MRHTNPLIPGSEMIDLTVDLDIDAVIDAVITPRHTDHPASDLELKIHEVRSIAFACALDHAIVCDRCVREVRGGWTGDPSDICQLSLPMVPVSVQSWREYMYFYGKALKRFYGGTDDVHVSG